MNLPLLYMIRISRLSLVVLGLTLLITTPEVLHAQCFSPSANYVAGISPLSVAIGDLNADGRPDMVTANVSSNNVTVLLAQAAGGYARTDYSTGEAPETVVLGDLNADGRLDMVTANFSSDNVTVLLAQPAGGYTRTDYTAADRPQGVTLGDLNADGRLDIVTANRSNSTTVLLAKATGGYTATTYSVGSTPYNVDLGDLNADGRLDIVTANVGSANVSVLLAQPGGDYTRTDYTADGGPVDVALGDLNSDGRLDIVTANAYRDDVTVLLAQPSGEYIRTDYQAGIKPRSLDLGDVNGDGRLDIVTTNTTFPGYNPNFFRNMVTVLVAQADGGYNRTDYIVGTDQAPQDATFADINGDGKLDIVTANDRSNDVTILLNTPAIAFTKQPTSTSVSCSGANISTSVTVSGPVTSYQWYKDNAPLANQTSATLSLPNVQPTTSGSYYVVVTGSCNSITSTVFSLTVNPLPTVTINSSTTVLCPGQSATLSAQGAATYQWRGPDNFASTSNLITVSTAGSYSVTGTSSAGCSASATTNLTGAVTPGLSLTNNGPLTCARTVVALTASANPTGGTYRFTGPGANENTASPQILVVTPGLYNLTYTSPQGCTATTTSNVEQDVAQPQLVVQNDGPLTCAKTSVTIRALPGQGATIPQGTTYQWSGPGGLSSNGSSFTTAQAGSYSLTVTFPNSCSSAYTTLVESNTATPSASLINNGPITCNQRTVTLNADGGGTYSFSPGASQVNGGSQATVTNEGPYSVTVTGSNGCTATQTTQVSSNTTTPTATLGNDGPITCNQRTVTLNAGGGGTYAFSNGATANGDKATVTNEGPYSVTVTSANGCTATQTTTVSSNTTAPNATLNNNGPITANQPTVTLTAGSGISYAFSSGASQQGGGNTATTTTPGNYQVTVTGANGCTATAATIVTGAVSGSSCRNGTGVIKVVVSGTPVKYEWYRNSITSARLTENPAQVRGTSTASLTLVNQQVTADYYVRVTDANGSAVVYGPFRFTVNTGCNIYARQGAQEVELRINVLGNPLQGDQLKAVISGAEGRALNVQLLDLQGRAVQQQSWQQADQNHSVEWSMSGQSSGVYLLQATTPDQRQSLKVIKP